MGLLGSIGKIIIGGIVGGPGGAIAVFTVEHGADVLEGTIDVARQIVRIGTDVYRAIPPEAFVLGGDPIHGLLKHEAEDELIMVGLLATDMAIFTAVTWPAAGPFGAAPHTYVTGRLLLGKLHHRLLNDEEWEMARYIFRDSSLDRADIILTNLGGKDGRPFTYPMAPLGRPVLVNLSGYYRPDESTPNAPLLYHELTHVWQAKQRVLREIFFWDARVQITEGEDDAYPFAPGRQWNKYNLEQQAGLVEAWVLGATERGRVQTGVYLGEPTAFDVGVRRKLALGSPVFRYINANVRPGEPRARTSDGRSVRNLLIEGGHRTLRQMHPEPAPPWWE